MMEPFQNESMPKELHWRLVRAFTNGDKEEVIRLNNIWFQQIEGAA